MNVPVKQTLFAERQVCTGRVPVSCTYISQFCALTLLEPLCDTGDEGCQETTAVTRHTLQVLEAIDSEETSRREGRTCRRVVLPDSSTTEHHQAILQKTLYEACKDTTEIQTHSSTPTERTINRGSYKEIAKITNKWCNGANELPLCL